MREELIFVSHLNTPVCSDRLSSALYASDLLKHHFSLYCGLEARSEDHTHEQLCVYVSLDMCVYIRMTVGDVDVILGQS